MQPYNDFLKAALFSAYVQQAEALTLSASLCSGNKHLQLPPLSLRDTCLEVVFASDATEDPMTALVQVLFEQSM